MPARPGAQDAFFKDLQTSQDATRKTLGLDPLSIDWQVAKDMLNYTDTPSHESYMPNFQRADAANKALGSKFWTTPGLNVGTEIDALVTELNGIFAETP
jgi:multiple sugar transport system substrate-binding protein